MASGQVAQEGINNPADRRIGSGGLYAPTRSVIHGDGWSGWRPDNCRLPSDGLGW